MKRVVILILALVLSVLLCGCTVTNGLFTGFSYNATDKAINASYASFNGSITQRLSLKEGDALTFRYTEDESLKAAVKQNGTPICTVADLQTFTVPADGIYDVSVEGKSAGGAFSLAWQID